MINQYELVCFRRIPALELRVTTRHAALSTESAIELTRKKLKEGQPPITSAVSSFLEEGVHIELQLTRSGTAEVVCLTQVPEIPETLVATLSGRRLRELIGGSQMIDLVIGEREIRDCYYSSKLKLVRVELADARSG